MKPSLSKIGTQVTNSPVDLPQFSIIPLKWGSTSLRSLQFQETFHPVAGPRVEAARLHIEQQALFERASKIDNFIIWDVGFGAGANALAAVEALATLKSKVQLHSFDKSRSAIDFALEHSASLDYLEPHKRDLETLLAHGKLKVREDFDWFFHLEDFRESLGNGQIPAPHAIFYDPYSPVSNPEVWNLEHFKKVFLALDPQKPCLLTNYTRSTAARTTLLLAGFFVGIGRDVGEKAETTIASNCLSLLERPLSLDWLKRVRSSRNAAPMMGSQYSQSPIGASDLALLEQHPQFHKR